MSQNPPEQNDVSTVLATRPPSGPVALATKFAPLTDDQAWALAERIKNSQILPKDFIGKPENIFIAILMGREVGLPAMQAVQNIMVVNGRPSMWGDSLPALVYASGKVAKFEEEYDEKTKVATCTVRRIGDTKDHVQKFSWADAIQAGYDKKSGPWQTNPKRMMQMRARAFGLRDKFADVLKGLGMVEEAQDYEILNPTKSTITMPTEIIDTAQEKSETFSAQETVASQAGDAPAEHPKILAAKQQFLEKYALDGATIDNYLAWHKLTTFGEIYPRLQSLWKDLKSGAATVDVEFGRFQSAKEATKPDDALL